LFFCGRSEYFKSLSHFNDAASNSNDGQLIVELKDIQPEVFTVIYTFIYTDFAIVSIIPEIYRRYLPRSTSW